MQRADWNDEMCREFCGEHGQELRPWIIQEKHTCPVLQNGSSSRLEFAVWRAGQAPHRVRMSQKTGQISLRFPILEQRNRYTKSTGTAPPKFGDEHHSKVSIKSSHKRFEEGWIPKSCAVLWPTIPLDILYSRPTKKFSIARKRTVQEILKKFSQDMTRSTDKGCTLLRDVEDA